MKEKPSTNISNVLFRISAFLINIVGVFIFMFGLFMLADSQINFMGVVDYIQVLDAVRDEQLMESAKRIKLILGFGSIGLGIMSFIFTWIMRMVIRRNRFINKMIDEWESMEWSDGEAK